MNAQREALPQNTAERSRHRCRSVNTGNGKIANLPSHTRDELNRRINDGEEGRELLDWLNAIPEVVDVVTRLFDGKPISQQNLSLWRTGGYRQWHVHHIIVQEMLALDTNSTDFKETGVDCEKLMLALKANYCEMIQRWIITPTEQMTYRLDVFKDLSNFVLGMRRTEQKDERLELDRERFEFARETKRGKSPAPSGSSSSAPPATLPQTPVGESGDSAPATKSVVAPQPAENPSLAPLNPPGNGGGDAAALVTLNEPIAPSLTESLDRATLVPSSSSDPKVVGSNIEGHDAPLRVAAAGAGLCETGSGLPAPREPQPAISIEPSNRFAPSFSPQPAPPVSAVPVAGLGSPLPAESSKRVDAAEVPEPIKEAEILEPAERAESLDPVGAVAVPEVSETRESLPAEVPASAHPIIHSALGDPEAPRLPDDPPSDLPAHPSSPSHDSSSVAEHQEEAPKALPDCANLSDDRALQENPRPTPPTSCLLSPAKSHRHRRDRRRRQSDFDQRSAFPPVARSSARDQASFSQPIAPMPAPSSQPAVTVEPFGSGADGGRTPSQPIASIPPAPPTVPAPMPAIPPTPPTPQAAPFWPNRQPGGPPRNASPRNPLGLL